MKKVLFLLFLLTVSLSATSQITFEKGYIIDNNGTKTECLIENKDWVYNPQSIQYKLTETASPQEGNLATIKEFGVYNYSQYVRAVVQVDKSKTYPINELSNVWSPEWETDTLFLKSIVQGKADLYSYEVVKMKKFFYATPADSSIRQLLYKQYSVSPSSIKDNVSFRQQLINEVRCQMPSSLYFEKISYDMTSLRKHFEKYNQCMGDKSPDYKEVVVKPTTKRNYLNVRVTPGVSYSALDVNFSAGNLIQNLEFNKTLVPRAGLEIEYILGFNKNKWSFFVEPSYQTYKNNKIYTTSYGISYQYKAEYQSIELPIGVRYYFFLNDRSRVFLNVVFLLSPIKYFGNPRVAYGTTTNGEGTKLEVKGGNSFAVGGGYSIGNFSLEARYHITQNVLSEYQYISADYRRLSLLVGYRLLTLKRRSAY